MNKVISFLRSSILFSFVKLGTFFIIPFLFYLIPIDFFEQFGTLCLIKRFTGHECWGCGTTHAFYSIMHLDFADAFKFNKLSFIVFALMVYIWGAYVYKEFKHIRFLLSEKKRLKDKNKV